MEPGWMSARQIEAARIAMTRHVRRGGKVWIRVFPDKPVTAKPAETRMGSGKGNPEFWVAVVRPGRVMFEIAGVYEALGSLGNGARHPEAADQGALCYPRPSGRGRGLDEPRPLNSGKMNDDELAHHLAESKEELFSLRFQLAMGKQDNSARLGQRQARSGTRALTLQGERKAGTPGRCRLEPQADKRKVAR